MTRNEFKRKVLKTRRAFRKELRALCDADPAFRVACIASHRANLHHIHIMKMWQIMIEHPDFRSVYDKTIGGSMLTGSEDAWTILFIAAPELYEKYKYSMPEAYARGDMTSTALASNRARNRAS